MKKMDMKEKLSLLWIFAIFNYIYADVFSIYVPELLEELMTGMVGGIQLTPVFLLGGAILMETAIVMVFLSRVLKYRANRLANIISGAIHTLAVFLSMFVGTPTTLNSFVMVLIYTSHMKVQAVLMQSVTLN